MNFNNPYTCQFSNCQKAYYKEWGILKINSAPFQEATTSSSPIHGLSQTMDTIQQRQLGYIKTGKVCGQQPNNSILLCQTESGMGFCSASLKGSIFFLSFSSLCSTAVAVRIITVLKMKRLSVIQ